MMVCVKAITVRFHLNHPAEKQAWEKLNALRREQHRSFSQLVTDAVNDYATDRLRFSDAERNQLVQEITESVSLRLQQIFPTFLAGYSAGANAPAATTMASLNSTPTHSPPNPLDHALDDTMPDFGESCMDFDFIGG